MDAFDQMRNMNIATSNMDPDNMDTNIQQQQHQQQQILHHPHHYQDNNYGVVPGIQEHHDQLHHGMHVGHLEPNNHLEESSHINQLSSHIDPSNIHHQHHHHHHHHMNDSVSGDVSNISDIGHLPVEPEIEKVNNYEQHSENLVHSNIRDDGGVPTVEKVLFEAITSFDDDESQNVQSNLEETLLNKDNNDKIEDDGNCENEKTDGGGCGVSTDKIIEDENVNEKLDSNDAEDCKDNITYENPVEAETVPVEGDAAIVEPIEPTKPNGVTEVILMDEPAVDTEGEEEGVEENQEDVLAGELADTEVAKAIDVKPITNFVIKVKDIMKDDKTLQQINRRSGRKTPAIKSESPLLQSDNKRAGPKSRARSNTPIDQIKKNNSNSAAGNQTSSTKKGEDIDENQCRICLSKDDLVSIFKSENRQTIADKIITICTGVRIQRKDFLPQFICNTCMQSVQVAYNLKRLCEATDKDLRSKLSRSKKNMRRPTEYVLLDATKFGESDESIDEPSDDDEFKISNEEELKSSEQESEADSDYGSGKRRSRRVRSRKSTAPSRRRRASKPTPAPQKSVATTFRQAAVKQAAPAATTSRSTPSRSAPTSRSTPSSRPAPASVKRGRKSDSSFEQNPITTNPDFSSGSDDNFSPPKKRQSRSSGGLNNNSTSTPPAAAKSNASKEGHCVYCNEIFPSQNALQKHKKIHAGEKPLICDLCGKTFKMAPSYQAHLAKHTEDGDTLMCTKCDKTFQKLSERRKHMIDEHNEKPETFPCEKCKRVFSLKKSLEKHIEDGKCPGPRKSITSNTAAAAPQQQQQQQQQRRVKSEMENLTLGRDLFKCVAPVTTTYWSDSFSD